MDTGLRGYGELLMDICFPSFQYAHSVPGHGIQYVPRYYFAPFASEGGLFLRVAISTQVLNASNWVGFGTRPPGFVISGYLIHYIRSILDLVQNPQS